jgi:hypothetical protein
MNNTLPPWALQAATVADYDLVKAAHEHGRLQLTWPDPNAIRRWAKHHGWPTPLFDFEAAFIAKMLETNAQFELAITTSGVAIHLPTPQYAMTHEQIHALDALYAQRSASGRPTGWGILVEELRAIRRAVELGVVVQIEDEQTLRDWQTFYQWAHGRYHMLEDGADAWIGDDQ